MSGAERIIHDLWRDILRIPMIFYLAALFLVGLKCGYELVSITAACLLFGVSIVALVLILAAQWQPRWIKLAVLAFFLAAGCARSAYEVYRSDSDFKLISSADKALEVKCRVLEITSVKRLKGRAARYRLKVGRPRIVTRGHSLSVPLTVNWYGDHDASVTDVPQPGELWQFKGRFYRSPRRGGRAGLVVNSGEGRSQCLKGVNPQRWERRIVGFRNDAARRVAYGIEDKKHIVEINQAVLLGLKDRIPRGMKKVFACSGTIHVFAISGLHIALIASVFVFIISSCGVPRYFWVFLLAPLLLIYTLATGMRPSAVRATLMAIIFFAAPFFGRRFNALTALACAALLTHLVSPAYISDIGSILSFSVMLGLVLLFKPVNHLFEHLFRIRKLQQDADLFAAAGELKSAHSLRQRVQLLTFLAGLCAVTVAAWLASMPLSGYFFKRVTPGGLLANLVISPCALMLVIAGVTGYGASFISGALAAVFNNAAGFFTLVMIKTAALISGCPGAHFKVPAFSAWLVWGWFGLLFSTSWLSRRWIKGRDDGMDWLGKSEM